MRRQRRSTSSPSGADAGGLGADGGGPGGVDAGGTSGADAGGPSRWSSGGGWRRKEEISSAVATHADRDPVTAGSGQPVMTRRRAQIRRTRHQRARLGPAMGSIGLARVFLFFKTINGGGGLNLLTEAGMITASVIPPLTVTFNWRRLPLPASKNQK